MEHLWLTGLDIYDLMEGDLYHLMGGAFVTQWAGHLSLNGRAIMVWVGHLWPKWVGQLTWNSDFINILRWLCA